MPVNKPTECALSIAYIYAVFIIEDVMHSNAQLHSSFMFEQAT